MIKRSYHGKVGTPEYNSWRGMIERCENKNHEQYADYGGRGVTVCKKWRESFPTFLKDMGKRPPESSIERRENDKPYSPKNCFWATRKQQARNKRNNYLITAFGRTQTLAAWAEETGIKAHTLRTRIKRDGWPVEIALSEKPNPNRPKRRHKAKSG